MEKGLLIGLMGKNMLDNIKKIKRKDLVNLVGLMEKNMKGNGKMENRMERGF